MAADLRNADLRMADLIGADLRDAYVQAAVGLDRLGRRGDRRVVPDQATRFELPGPPAARCRAQVSSGGSDTPRGPPRPRRRLRRAPKAR
ncbi:pentapeptide repeat-containing protein [Actinoallomurus liliacearum]|uniref:pentapeptide repeat-containing protein n=1 Tax=Actinoallomurus liliacearum TaxID=1080073 RepID=UPI003CD07C12